MKAVIKKQWVKFLVMILILIMPAIVFCQAPPGPGDDNPDVPFDGTMNLLFLAAGLVFAAVIVRKKLSKKVVADI